MLALTAPSLVVLSLLYQIKATLLGTNHCSSTIYIIIYLNCSASRFVPDSRLVAAKNDLVVLEWVELIKSDSDCSDLLIVSMITGRSGLINNECIPCPCRPIQTNVRSAGKKSVASAFPSLSFFTWIFVLTGLFNLPSPFSFLRLPSSNYCSERDRSRKGKRLSNILHRDRLRKALVRLTAELKRRTVAGLSHSVSPIGVARL